MERLIKKVKPEAWRVFRSEAAKHGLKAGEFLGYLVEEHTKAEMKGNNWDMLLSRKKLLTTREARKVRRAIQPFEEDYTFE